MLHNESQYPTKKDVRLISGPGCNDFFPGITVYVDSEAGQIILTRDAIGKGLIYIGVSDQTVLNTLKLNFKEKFMLDLNLVRKLFSINKSYFSPFLSFLYVDICVNNWQSHINVIEWKIDENGRGIFFDFWFLYIIPYQQYCV